MTAAQYRTAIERLGLTQAQAAEYLGVSVRTSHGYANGAPIPLTIAKLLHLIDFCQIHTDGYPLFPPELT